MLKSEKLQIVIGGSVIGLIGALMVFEGNPKNMGFCIACFIRDIAGALGLHTAKAVQYMRPEIFGIVLGSFAASRIHNEFSARGGSAVITRFILGIAAMVGSLMFLGCPLRMVLRLAGGDLNAVMGLIGFVCGTGIGIFFLNHGYSLGRTYKQPTLAGTSFSILQLVLLAILLFVPEWLMFTQKGAGPGGSHAALTVSLGAGLLVGYLAQRIRLCMVGGIRDFILFRDDKLLLGFVAVFISCLIGNVVLESLTGTNYFKLGFSGQSIAHTDGLWNYLGMLLTGLACVLLGGCPLRQLILAGEGNSDSAVTVFGLTFGAALAHRFGLASSAAGATANGKLAVSLLLAIIILFAVYNAFIRRK